MRKIGGRVKPGGVRAGLEVRDKIMVKFLGGTEELAIVVAVSPDGMATRVRPNDDLTMPSFSRTVQWNEKWGRYEECLEA